MTKPDDGHAFPVQPVQVFEEAVEIRPELGMTLRDFAAAALSSMLGTETYTERFAIR